MTSGPFDPSLWRPVDGFDFTDITYHRHVVGGADRGTAMPSGRTPSTSCTGPSTMPG